MLMSERTNIVEAAIRSQARDLGCLVHGVAVQPDHVHVAISIPPKHAPASVIGRLKGASSRLLRQRDPELVEQAFGWQHEYGVISFSARDFGFILNYLAHQDERHAETRLVDQLERDVEEHHDY
jgi:putative transposase